MKKVLIPVDFSETSENALAYACKIFDKHPLEITLVNIFGATSTALMMKSIDSILIKEAKESLSKLEKKYKALFPDVQFKSQLYKNYAVQTIVSLADSGDYDLIIMGTKGASGVKEVFLGSIAGGVISKTKAPVIVVPSEYQFSSLDKIIFAINDSKILEKTNLDTFKSISELHQSKIIALHIDPVNKADYKSYNQEVKGFDFEVVNIQGTGKINEDINSFLTKNKADLLCLIRSKKDFIGRLFDGSVTSKQTFSSSIPLLILHELGT